MEQCNATVDTTIKVTKKKSTNKIIISYAYGEIELDTDFTNPNILKLLIDPSIDEIIEAVKEYQDRVTGYYGRSIENLYQFKEDFEIH